MKKIIISSLMIVSLTISAQYKEHRTIEFGDNLSSEFKDVAIEITNTLSEITFEVDMEEADEAFDFDIQEFLPKDFNPFHMMYETYSLAYEYLFEEEDEAFDFDTKAYLPEGFDPYEDKSIMEEYTALQEESDEPFEFDTRAYLPENFNAYSESDTINMEYEILNEEADEPFDFDSVEYLPIGFNANK